MSSPKEFLLKLHKGLQILELREAKYGGMAAPVSLLMQIEDYRKAIKLTEQAIENDISIGELEVRLVDLNLEIRDTIEFKPARKPFDGRNPYRGLEKFTEDDHEFFFGRSATTAKLVNMTQVLIDADATSENPALLTVIGASGSGKSSLVRAGLIPALRKGHILHSESWPIRVMLPGPKPIESLAQSFVKLAGRGLRSILDDLHRDEQGLHYLIKEVLADEAENTNLTLVIDQFEELFTLCEREEERQDFIKLLLYEATHRHHRGLTILTMRADFYGQASQYPQLAQALTVHQMLVAPMTPRELREAIRLPAEEVGLEMEKDLALALVQDTVNEPGALPLLQHTLLELFNRRSEDNVLTMEAYREIGGVRGALAHRADDVLNHLTVEQRELARNIFLRLTTLGEGVSDTRRRVNRQELYPTGADPEAINTVLQALSGKEARLVVTDEETVEVTHEALIQQWGQLREWLEENRDSLRIHRRVTEAAKEWEANERDESYLFRGARLVEIEAWVAKHDNELTPGEWAFVSASIERRDQQTREEEERHQRELAQQRMLAEEQKKRAEEAEARQKAEEERATEAEARQKDAERASRRSRRLLTGLTLVMVIALAAAFLAFRQARTATARQLAADSQIALLDGDIHLATLLALEAQKLDPQIDWMLTDYIPYHLDGAIVVTHSDKVNSVAWSPDGRHLASGSEDGAVIIWDSKSGKALTTISDLPGRVTSVGWSSDGQRLASQSEGEVIIWDSKSGQTLDTSAGVYLPPSYRDHSHYSPVVRREVVYKSATGSLFIADIDGTEQDLTLGVFKLGGLFPGDETVAWSSDGRHLASGLRDGTIIIWDSESGKALTTFGGHSASVDSVDWSPDGRLASGSRDQTVRILPAQALQHPCEWLTGANLDSQQWVRYRGWAIYQPTCDNLTVDYIPNPLRYYVVSTQDGSLISNFMESGLSVFDYGMITWGGRLTTAVFFGTPLILLGVLGWGMFWLGRCVFRRVRRRWAAETMVN